MRSVLISTDLVKRGDGTWTPLEINTNSGHELKLIYDTDSEGNTYLDFSKNLDSFFNHLNFDLFLKGKNISKIIVIDKKGGSVNILKSFCTYYSYEFQHVEVPEGSLTIPEVEDKPNELVVRISYDSYALLDDLYARDMYEFHNLIKDENFASPVAFNSSLGLDRIDQFEPSIDGKSPNYVIKPRTPGYPKNTYPKLFRIDSIEELNALKTSLNENEFIQKYEINKQSGLVNNKVSFIRSMDLVYGDNLDVLNLVTYKSINSVSIENSLLRYDSELLPDKKLDPLFAMKWYPKNSISKVQIYHFDETDNILLPDYTQKKASELSVGENVLGFKITEEIKNFQEGLVTDLSLFTTNPTPISDIVENPANCLFINLTAIDENGNEFRWYDGLGNKYLIQKAGSNAVQYISEPSGNIEVGDNVYVFDTVQNLIKPLNITDIYYDIKNLKTYKITLQNEYREFLINLEGDLFLLQHNFSNCFPSCGTIYTCASVTTFGQNACNLCSKYSPGCPNCTAVGTSFICNSDLRFKKNISMIGESPSGIKIYTFSYKDVEGLYQGVIAQDLIGTQFEDALIVNENGMYRVDYNKLDVQFKKIN